VRRLEVLAVTGQLLSYAALAFGLIFFIFTSKYYVAILLALLGGWSGNGNGGKGNVNNNIRYGFINQLRRSSENSNKNGQNDFLYRGDSCDDDPFVSIHLPFYNEKNVARRIIQACVDIDYTNYEILVLDDSSDGTIEILKELVRRRGPPTIKFVHRKDRRGFKGGALAEAINHMDPRTEFIVVFDADFIPPPNVIRRFLWYFGGQNNSKSGEDNTEQKVPGKVIDFHNNLQNKEHNGTTLVDRVEEWYERRRIAAVQGYQRHNLNKGENWITKGVRAEFSGSYMIERVAEEFFGAMKMISGSVFMIKADIVKKLGWTTSITEDWDLTIRLYLAGYKVVYTPLIQAPAEIPTTVRRLTRQRMRWAEGHTYAVKKYFWDVLRSPMLTFREKLEFLYFAPYYLQSFFFLMGTLCWMSAEGLRQYPWFWTPIFGWCLIFSNLFALPLMGLTGLFLERSAQDDFTGIFSFIVLSYVVTPFQAYAALKGLIEKDEGGWIRTLKTGSITDRVLQIRIRKLFSWILPSRERRRREKQERRSRSPLAIALIFLVPMSSLIVLVSVAAIAVPEYDGSVEEKTALSFEHFDELMIVNGIETNRVLTHPDYSELDEVHVDSYYASGDGWKHAWSFYLYGPLEQNYNLKGELFFILYMYADRECEVNILFKIRDVDWNGKIKHNVNIMFRNLKVDSSPPNLPLELKSKPLGSKKFKSGHTILVDVYLKRCGEEDVTYYLDYGSNEKNSRIEFPGLVMPESVLSLIAVAPLIPIAIRMLKKEERYVFSKVGCERH
jgi:cellulose synthase/poly-beta-1,6-N-acetylglucosamine synthase-like glycosyltransferase